MLFYRSGEFTGYREKTYGLIKRLLLPLGRIDSAIDVGCGEGWFTNRLMHEGIIKNCIPLEVSRRKLVEIEPTLYDGKVLPFPDNYVQLAYAIDVVHHAANPTDLLREMARVSSKWILLKDHSYKSIIGRLTLQILDEIGNRRFEINSPGKYQQAWSWIEYLDTVGFSVATTIYPAPVHSGVLGYVTNPLQFAVLLQKNVN
jgi:SAM-dependent methyltransferase